MTGAVIGFVIWCIAGSFFIALGIYSLFSKKAIGFWANFIRPYTSADNTDGHNIYEEVILGRDGFFRAVKLLKDAVDM